MFDDPNDGITPDAISAVKALQKASAAGQRIYQITQANMTTALPNIHHDSATMDEIRAALNAGKEVTTHTDAVSVPGWSGAGYIILDPDTGSGAYKIAGGKNGGWFIDTVGGMVSILPILSIGVLSFSPGIVIAFTIFMAAALAMLFVAGILITDGAVEVGSILCTLAVAFIIAALMLLFKNPFKAGSIAAKIVTLMVGTLLAYEPSKGCSVANR